MSEESITLEFYNRNCQLTKKFPSKKKTLTHLVYIERNCFSNCVKNMCAMEALAGCELELIAGSVGLCSLPGEIWYEWGGFKNQPHTTVQQFRRCEFTGLPDVHFWFETPDGKIYDVVDRYLLETVAPLYKKTVECTSFVHGYVILGHTRAALETCGLTYVPASPLVQEILVKHHAANIAFKELK